MKFLLCFPTDVCFVAELLLRQSSTKSRVQQRPQGPAKTGSSSLTSEKFETVHKLTCVNVYFFLLTYTCNIYICWKECVLFHSATHFGHKMSYCKWTALIHLSSLPITQGTFILHTEEISVLSANCSSESNSCTHTPISQPSQAIWGLLSCPKTHWHADWRSCWSWTTCFTSYATAQEAAGDRCLLRSLSFP